jgi:hypothetical protein
VHACGAGLDHRLHQLEGVQGAAEARLGVGDDRQEVVDPVAALDRRDLVGTHQRVVQPPHERRRAVRRVEALVRIRLAGEVCVRRHLPARQVDRLQPGLCHLDGLAACHRAERVDVSPTVEHRPEALGPDAGQGVLDVDRAAERDDLLGRIRPLDSLPAAVRLPFAGERLRAALGCGAVQGLLHLRPPG